MSPAWPECLTRADGDERKRKLNKRGRQLQLFEEATFERGPVVDGL